MLSDDARAMLQKRIDHLNTAADGLMAEAAALRQEALGLLDEAARNRDLAQEFQQMLESRVQDR